MKGWEPKLDTSTSNGKSGIAELKRDYVNGDLGFDPLNLKPDTKQEFETMRTKELQNGRLAMIGVTGMVVQELIDKKGIWEHFGY